jgi:hypothetical protein
MEMENNESHNVYSLSVFWSLRLTTVASIGRVATIVLAGHCRRRLALPTVVVGIAILVGLTSRHLAVGGLSAGLCAGRSSLRLHA